MSQRTCRCGCGRSLGNRNAHARYTITCALRVKQEREQGGDVPTRQCRCGCGQPLQGRHGNARYATENCRLRVAIGQTERRRKAYEGYKPIVEHDPCSYCGRRAEFWKDHIGIDHIEPIAQGGLDHWSNLTGCCKYCNSSKRVDSLLIFLLRVAAW